jgi:hypothetical protein
MISASMSAAIDGGRQGMAGGGVVGVSVFVIALAHEARIPLSLSRCAQSAASYLACHLVFSRPGAASAKMSPSQIAAERGNSRAWTASLAPHLKPVARMSLSSLPWVEPSLMRCKGRQRSRVHFGGGQA